MACISRFFRPHRSFLLFLVLLAYSTFFYMVIRVWFFIKYLSYFAHSSSQDILLAFVHGIRFDASVLIKLLAVFMLILHIPGYDRLWVPLRKWLTRILLGLSGLVAVLSLFVLVIDIQAYDYASRHLTFELVSIGHDFGTMVKTAGASFAGAIVLFFAGVSLFLWGWFALSGRIMRGSEQLPSNPGRDFFYFFVFAALVVFIGRGGWQLKPLRTSNAFLTNQVILGHLSLNGAFTTMETVMKVEGLQKVRLMPDEEAFGLVRNQVFVPGEEVISDRFPLMRRSIWAGPSDQSWNVVILMMESFTASHVGATGGPADVTPFFDALARESILFTNFYATGSRSIEGVPSCLCSLPSFSDTTLIGNTFEQGNLRCLGHILREAGYRTLFIHGARLGSFGFDAFARVAGFERFLSRDDFDLSVTENDPVWGIYDEPALLRCHQEISGTPEPFFLFFFSLTAHEPFALPDKKFVVFPDDRPDHQFLDTLRYSDYSLSRFFEQARHSSYYDHTMFVILGDHTIGKGLHTSRDLFRIPCLIHAPALLKPAVIDRVSSQMDILPTILELLQLQTPHASFGYPLLARDQRNRVALFSRGDVLGLISSSYLLESDTEKAVGLYDFTIDQHLARNLLNEERERASQMHHLLSAYLQVTHNLMFENRLYPPAHWFAQEPKPE